jgi:hypothetical protein
MTSVLKYGHMKWGMSKRKGRFKICRHRKGKGKIKAAISGRSCGRLDKEASRSSNLMNRLLRDTSEDEDSGPSWSGITSGLKERSILWGRRTFSLSLRVLSRVSTSLPQERPLSSPSLRRPGFTGFEHGRVFGVELRQSGVDAWRFQERPGTSPISGSTTAR